MYKDSRFVGSYQSSLTESIRNERDKMTQDGTLVSEGEVLVLSKDYVFTSSSRAAAIVLGRSARGTTEWKTDKGMQLNQVEALGG